MPKINHLILKTDNYRSNSDEKNKIKSKQMYWCWQIPYILRFPECTRVFENKWKLKHLLESSSNKVKLSKNCIRSIINTQNELQQHRYSTGFMTSKNLFLVFKLKVRLYERVLHYKLIINYKVGKMWSNAPKIKNNEKFAKKWEGIKKKMSWESISHRWKHVSKVQIVYLNMRESAESWKKVS